ncbi:MAG TPA: type II CAAX endopeptidase family protein [Dongiaceae bacterium]|nr:type II CAAX endopeptidase family protein [Dongiaceae bacterium]
MDRPLLTELIAALALFYAWSFAQLLFVVLHLPPTAATVQVALVALLFAARYVLPSPDPAQQRRRERGSVRPLGGYWPWTVVAAAAIAVMLVVLTGIVAHIIPSPEPPDERIVAYLAQPRGWVPFAAGALLADPLVGEVIFRGWVQGRLTRDLGPEVAIVNTAALYAIANLDLPFVPTNLVLGLACGYAVYLTGSIWSAVLTSAALNAAMLVATGPLPWFDLRKDFFADARTIAGGAGVMVVSGAVAAFAFHRLKLRRDAEFAAAAERDAQAAAARAPD